MRVEKGILYDHFLSRTLDFFKKVNKISFSKEPFILNKVSPKEQQLPLRFLHLDLLQEECWVNVRRKSKIERKRMVGTIISGDQPRDNSTCPMQGNFWGPLSYTLL